MSTLAGRHGAAQNRHKSIEALLKEYAGETDAKALMRRLAREKVAYAKSHRWAGPPFCPKVFAGIFGIRCKEVTHEIDGDGRILLYPDGSIWIEYRTERVAERQRFTMFHEFAHTLFPDFCKFLPHHSSGKPKDPEKEFENLCDIAASEMLLPLENVNEDLARIPRVCLEEITRLSSRYAASIDATTLRLVELLVNLPCVAVFLTDEKGSRSGHGPLWTKYSMENPGHGSCRQRSYRMSPTVQIIPRLSRCCFLLLTSSR